jgi:TM2 domain-containing membrane protein YozV
MSPRPAAAASLGLPSRGLAHALLALGLAGLVTELVSTAFAPRLVLFLAVLACGVVGSLRRPA